MYAWYGRSGRSLPLRIGKVLALMSSFLMDKLVCVKMIAFLWSLLGFRRSHPYDHSSSVIILTTTQNWSWYKSTAFLCTHDTDDTDDPYLYRSPRLVINGFSVHVCTDDTHDRHVTNGFSAHVELQIRKFTSSNCVVTIAFLWSLLGFRRSHPHDRSSVIILTTTQNW